ncbi:MAG: cobalt-precorrin-5B (C(1))-methyltransferase CbiD, partial [Lachnospiraceae bacterium]|nr:cobalt-precorrin-5B (C(1))-methyltransferase CbiD [Lachnospiraceae bacterium]
MRNGFTTGSCAAAASKAAMYMLITGKDKKSISIDTPKGIAYTTDILDIQRTEDSVTCAVKKDSGDDPDITNGMLVYSTVSFIGKEKKSRVSIDGGEGVGRVTKPGLDQTVGEAAINSVPRQMIEKEVKEVCDLFDIEEDVKVIISVPGGKEIALKTFNPKLGIEGGISIIGTSGIVEPMSTKALLDT